MLSPIIYLGLIKLGDKPTEFQVDPKFQTVTTAIAMKLAIYRLTPNPLKSRFSNKTLTTHHPKLRVFSPYRVSCELQDGDCACCSSRSEIARYARKHAQQSIPVTC